MAESRRSYVVLTTVDSPETAQRLARLWVESRRAACVTMLPAARSIYRWKGELCDESEVVMLVKTAARDRDDLAERLESFASDHPYEVPELLALAPEAGWPAYTSWVAAEVE